VSAVGLETTGMSADRAKFGRLGLRVFTFVIKPIPNQPIRACGLIVIGFGRIIGTDIRRMV
jgi:hypothetical protein